MKRKPTRVKLGGTHIDRDTAILIKKGLNEPSKSIHLESSAWSQPLIGNKACKASGAIAALLNLVAIRIEDPIVEYRLRHRRPGNKKHLVSPHSKTTIGKLTDRFGAR